MAKAAELMDAFALRTEGKGRRYLWTDAFAVETYLALAAATSEPRYVTRAQDLVVRVHRELGRGSADHPLAGGLRIGKPLPERGPNEPYDAELEWERDGQYFHYLTKWMLALDQLARRTSDETNHRWARELATVAHGAFAYGERGERRMFWKLSVDLTRPLVLSMGQHDPLDGYVTCVELDASARELGFQPVPDLALLRDDFATMARETDLGTSDPLGIGELLVAARRLERAAPGDPLAVVAHDAAVAGLRSFIDLPELRLPVDRRLAFRELGLAIGLAGVRSHDSELQPYALLRTEIETFWLDPAHQRAASWRKHEDINDVMLAAALCAPVRQKADASFQRSLTPAAVGAVNHCIEVCIDGEKGYALAAADVRDPSLKSLLHFYAKQRADFVQELQGALGRLGVFAMSEGTGRGLAHRALIEAKRALGGPNDTLLLTACERGDRAALAVYDELFSKIPLETLTPELRSTLVDQRAAIQSAHDDVARRHA